MSSPLPVLPLHPPDPDLRFVAWVTVVCSLVYGVTGIALLVTYPEHRVVWGIATKVVPIVLPGVALYVLLARRGRQALWIILAAATVSDVLLNGIGLVRSTRAANLVSWISPLLSTALFGLLFEVLHETKAWQHLRESTGPTLTGPDLHYERSRPRSRWLQLAALAFGVLPVAGLSFQYFATHWDWRTMAPTSIRQVALAAGYALAIGCTLLVILHWNRSSHPRLLFLLMGCCLLVIGLRDGATMYDQLKSLAFLSTTPGAVTINFFDLVIGLLLGSAFLMAYPFALFLLAFRPPIWLRTDSETTLAADAQTPTSHGSDSCSSHA